MQDRRGWICLQSQTLPNWPRPSSLILVKSFDSICCRLLGISRAASWTSCHLPDPVHSPVAIPLPTISLDQAPFTYSPMPLQIVLLFLHPPTTASTHALAPCFSRPCRCLLVTACMHSLLIHLFAIELCHSDAPPPPTSLMGAASHAACPHGCTISTISQSARHPQHDFVSSDYGNNGSLTRLHCCTI